MDKVEALRNGDATKRRQSHVGRRQSLTSSHVEQMKETLKERAAKYKEWIFSRELKFFSFIKWFMFLVVV